MQLDISFASTDDYCWLNSHDHHIVPAALRRKIAGREILIAKTGARNAGWLRFGLFWDSIPFMNMLVVEEDLRGRGIGKALVARWEDEMCKQKYKMVMTSTLANEDAQHFYRRLGYKDAGSLLLPREPLEIIFIKKLKSA